MVSIKFEAPTGNYDTYYLYARDVDGTSLGSWTTKASASYSFNTAAAGDYYILAQGASGGIFDADYSLTLAQEGANAAYELEPNSGLSTAQTVVAGQAISGQANGESDYYKLVVPAASSGLLYAAIGSSSSTASWSVYLLNAVGSYIGSATLSNGTKTWVKLPGPGTYYANVYSSSSQATYDLTLTSAALSTTQENEPNNSTAQADTVVASTVFKARMSGSDTDYFKLTTSAAGMVSIKFEAPTGNYDTYYLYARDVDGTSLGSWTTKASASYSFNTAAAGDYYIRVDGASGGIFDADYSLTLGGSTIPTYSLGASSSSVNEGSTATFTLTTTNLTSGTSVPYTLSGISAADVSGGSLNGNAVVNSSGVATISVTLLNDLLTEGAETLTVTAGGSTASTVVNDTSKGTATYSLSAASTSVNEGSTAAFSLLTTNVAAGTSISYTITGVIAADITGGLTGTATVDANGTAAINLAVAADFLTEGAETLTVTAQGKSASMTINDTSKTAVTVPLIAGTAAADTITNLVVSQSIDGGAGIDTLVYTSNSTTVVISKSGGNTVVTNTATGEVDTLINVERLKFADTAIALDTSGVGGQAYRVYKAAFNRTPDLGGLGFWISGMDGGVSLNTVGQGFVNSAEFKAVYGTSPTNAQIVTRFYDNVLGRAADSGGYNYWLGVLNSGGGSVAGVLAAFSESSENQAGVIGVIGNGFAYTPFISPTYSLVAGATSVNEGAVANFTLNTTNVTSGTSIPYTLSGISSADVFGGALSGNAVVNSSGVATISVSLLNDLLTEGPETLTVTAGGASASTVVNDTSKAIATYSLVAGAKSVNEGSVANFTLNTTNVAAGTTVGYTLSGLSTADVFGSLLGGSATVNASGIATISVTLLNDLLTEGAETLTVTAGGATASILVNDTSITFVGIIDGGGGGGGGGGDGGNGG
jgi:hypothetical protein